MLHHHQVTTSEGDYVEIEYYVIRLGMGDIDVVLVSEQFVSRLSDQELHVVYGELRLVPQQHTVQLHYYSLRNYPDEIYVDVTSNEASTSQMVIVIVAIAGVIIMLLALAVICCVVRSSTTSAFLDNITELCTCTYMCDQDFLRAS